MRCGLLALIVQQEVEFQQTEAAPAQRQDHREHSADKRSNNCDERPHRTERPQKKIALSPGGDPGPT